ncbi:MAG: helix-turn-helix domain-containing protein [Micropruina sp.]|uniref:TetR/AcrR family transcriptional regulator n=1 Tax=Micropruina sp. TaxID=2737536 RepID=UPI0039E706A4
MTVDRSRTRRRRNSLNLDEILDAAERVAADGIESLTIRAVAEQLGASPMGLYRHVAGKDELIDLLLDRVLGRMPTVPETADPLHDLACFARTHRDLLADHPWAVPALVARAAPGPNAVPIGEQCLNILARAGVQGGEAVAVFSGVLALNYGWMSFALGRRRPEASASLARIEAGPRGDFPRTAAAGPELAQFGSDRHYDVVLARLCGLPGSA